MQITTKIVSSHTADSKPVKQEVKGTGILPPLVFLGLKFEFLAWAEEGAGDKHASLSCQAINYNGKVLY